MIKIAVNAELGRKSTSDGTIDKGKKIYRAAIDSIKKHDAILKDKKPYRSAFTQEAVGVRNRLKEYCERLMFLNPCTYGDKAQEVLWRKVFYSIIVIAKNNKRRLHSHGCVYSAFRTHMSAAIGFYHHLLFRLQATYSLHLDGFVDFHHITLANEISKKSDVGESETKWAIKACHQCLIYLGDIARYQDMFDGGGWGMVAQRNYYQALTLFPNFGMPFNQLGVLHSANFYSFDSAYHYIRCIVSEISFEGTRHNLQRLLERNRRHYSELGMTPARLEAGDQHRIYNIRRLFIRFMNLIDVFFNPNQMLNSHEVQEACQSTLQDFNLCMFYMQASQSADFDSSKPAYLTPDIVYKLVVASMAAVHQQQKCGCVQVTAAIAFFLALASHVTNHVVCRLQQSIESSHHPTTLPSVDNDHEEAMEVRDDERDATLTPTPKIPSTPQPTQVSNSSKKLAKEKARRKRRKNMPDASSGSESERADMSSDESDLSEGEGNLSLSSLSDDDFIDCSDHGSDSDLDSFTEGPRAKGVDSMQSPQNFQDMQKIWCDEGVSDSLALFSSKLFMASATAEFLSAGKTNAPKGSDVDDDFSEEIEEKLANFVIETDTEAVPTDTDVASDSDSDSPDRSTSPSRAEVIKRQENLIEILRCEPLLPVVKIITDWLRCHIQIIKTCAQSTQSLWSRLAMLLNLIPPEDAIADCATLTLSPVIRSHLREASEGSWGQCEPLSEDTNLRCFTPLSAVHERINFDLKSRTAMTPANDLAVRLVCLRQFGYITSNLPELEFSYKADESLFIGPIQSDSSPQDIANQQSAQEQLTAAETCKNRLMRDMAHLRLQREVDELQGELASTEVGTFPPYIVTDSWCLCEELVLVKQLVQTTQCVIIIPLAVIDTLDLKKKESIGARNAIRWLESEFKKGNRYVRDQKASERYNTNPRKNLKKRHRECWEMVMILDCASYLNQKTGQLCSSNMVAVLVNRDIAEWSKYPEVIHAINTARNQGLAIEKVKAFHNKWKHLWRSAR